MFRAGNNFGKFSKRGPSEDKEIKGKIKDLANGIIDSINIDDLTRTQKVNMLKACLPYLIAREIQTYAEDNTDLPLFVDGPPKVVIFKDRKELDEYNNMSEEEQNMIGETPTEFFGKGGKA
jgi:hypothetical protein